MLTVKQLAAFIGSKIYYIEGSTKGIAKLNPYVLNRLESLDEDNNDVVKLFLKPCHEMSVTELAEWTGEKFTEDFALEKIKTFSSLWGLQTFIGHYGNHDSITWLCDKGFDPFFYISRDLALHIDKIPEIRSAVIKASIHSFTSAEI